jgi:chromosome segregation ATPase
MKYLILALALALASCAPSIPRAILPPPSEVKELDVAAVSKATDKTRDAVREIAAAGNTSRKASRALADTSIQLRAAIDRAELLSRAKGEMEDAFAEIQRFALALSADVSRLKSALELAEQKEAIAIATVDSLSGEVSTLQSTAAAQAAEIRNAKAAEGTLRKQVESLSESADKRAIAEDGKRWWRKAALLTWAILILLAVGGALLRRAGRFPF